MNDWRDRSLDPTVEPNARYDPATMRRKNAAIIATRMELDRLAQEAWRRLPELEHDPEPPADAPVHPVTGRRGDPDEELVAFGNHLRRARHITGLSQDRLAAAAHVSQTMVSRVERGLAPGMSVAALVRIGRVLGRALPLAMCPHQHDCPWQPVVKPIFDKSREERWIELVLGLHHDADETESEAPSTEHSQAADPRLDESS